MTQSETAGRAVTDIDIHEIMRRIPHRPPFLMIARAEGVDIEALADPHIRLARGQQPFGRGKVFRRCHLRILLAAHDDQRRDAGRLGDRRVIGQHAPRHLPVRCCRSSLPG